TGRGLWPRTDIDFRGAAFPIGGDATIDGLITIPNILREFTSEDSLHGVSHGMGGTNELPAHQLNVAESAATTGTMPKQAKELVKRIKTMKEVDLYNTWAMVIITIGTEEVCGNCSVPDTEALIKAVDILKAGIHKALVILLGPIHVSSSYHQKANLLKTRCSCSKDQSNEFMEKLSAEWSRAFAEVAEHVAAYKSKNFGVLTLPMLTITSRYPYSLFIPNRPLLNRRGHNYATKWLWNRLIAGPKYNLSKAVLSQDAYFCPSVGCPYFRTPANFHKCSILKHSEAEEMERKAKEMTLMGKMTQHDHYRHALGIIGISSVTVIIFGTFFYYRSKLGTRGRFDAPPVPDGLVYKPYSLSVKKLNELNEGQTEEGTDSALLRSRPPSAMPFDVSQQNIFKELSR
uniref:SGNH_hydro domain-containing protein n=2 Tax=Bursaphelenchus xylophilus TaxID=6326 RepID=A0A1I7SHY9_BURXY